MNIANYMLVMQRSSVVIPSFEVLQLDLVRSCRRWLIQSNRSAFAFRLNKALYQVMQTYVVRSLSKLPGVRSIYLSHGAAIGETFPGLSDFDLVILYDHNVSGFASLLRHNWLKLKKYLPARDIVSMSAADFDQWQRCGGGEDLSLLSNWVLLFGGELRSQIAAPASIRDFDTVRNCIGYYWQLSQTVVKEAGYQPYLAIFERRQLYKFFCYSVLPLHSEYDRANLSDSLAKCLAKWGKELPDETSSVLLKWREKRFLAGRLSKERYSIAAQALYRIDSALADRCILSAPVYPSDTRTHSDLLSSNYSEVSEHLKPFLKHFIPLAGDLLRSVRVTGSGSPRGWRLFVVVREGLTQAQLEELFRIVAITFRMHDDPWFNEHFSITVPLIYTEALFRMHLRLWPDDALYFRNFPSTIFGEPHVSDELAPEALDRQSYERGEKLAFKRYLNQIFLERSRAGLYESVVLYFPRIFVKHQLGLYARTTDEAISLFERSYDGPERTYPREMFRRFAHVQLEEIRKKITESDFTRASDLFRLEFAETDYKSKAVNQ